MSYSLVTKSSIISTSDVSLYTCVGDNAIVFGLSLTNKLGSAITINVTLFSALGANTVDIVSPNTTLSIGESLVPIGGVQKLVMKQNDIIKVRCSSASGMDAVLSAMELNDYV